MVTFAGRAPGPQVVPAAWPSYALLVLLPFLAVTQARWLNGIPNSTAGWTDSGSLLTRVSLLLAIGLVAMIAYGIVAGPRPLRRLSIIAAVVTSLPIIGVLLGPVIGMAAFVLVNGYVFWPVALTFAVATLRTARHPNHDDTAAITPREHAAPLVAVSAYGLCLLLSNLVNKVLVLGWAAAND